MNEKNDLPDWSEEAGRLKLQYVPHFRESLGMPPEVAEEIFNTLVQEACEAALREHTDAWPGNFGEVLLHQEKVSEEVRQAFAPKRAEGVTDSDILHWWNLHDLDRRLIVRVDEIHRMVLFEMLVHKDGKEEAEAAGIVGRRLPIFGDPEFQGHGLVQDRPLPFELKGRVNRFLTRQKGSRGTKYRKKLESASSLNALLRQGIREGQL